MQLPLKDYQKETLRRLGEYCMAARARYDRGISRFEREAYEYVTDNRTYYAPPGFENVPYICLRLPTGGGKTILAAHALGAIGSKLLGTDKPACLWITPNTIIRDQTLRALQKPTHPYCLALKESLNCSVEVVTLEDALTRPRSVQADAALVIVTTIQSYRIRDERTGEELAATRRIYRDDGYIQQAFENLPAWAQGELSRDANGLINLSLANALKLRHPIVIMDEAHNARTRVSFDSLARFGPSFVLELTATPEQRHAPDHPKEPKFASNVLHAVSALELKKEGMIKMPVDLENRLDWQEVIAATVQRRTELETVADHAHRDIGLPFLRPIALIQAQPSHKNRETQTADKVKEFLLKLPGITEAEVKICIGTKDEIEGIDLMAGDCPVRYIITVDKLREGWDCSLAYVLGSIGNAATATAVEQLIGRILRMPNANPTNVPALDRAYAFVLSDNVMDTALQLRDRLVETCGFDERSAEDALRVTATQTQKGLEFGRIPLSEKPKSDTISPELAAKTHYDESSKTLVVNENLTRDEAKMLREAVATEQDRQAIEDYWVRERPIGSAVKAIDQYAKPLRVPRLAVEQGGRMTLLEPVELESFAWNLDKCDYALTEVEFEADVRVGSAATLNLGESADGRSAPLITEAVGDVRLLQLELIGEGDDWDEIELTRWLDKEIHRGDSFLGLAKIESDPWLKRVVSHLTQVRGISLPIVVRRRHRLADILRTKITDHGRIQTRFATDWLIDNRPEAIQTSFDQGVWIEEQDYAPFHDFKRPQEFKHHAFDMIADMDGEEFRCAKEIDSHPNIKRWIRNTETISQGGYWLPKSPGKFFPDFIVEMKDGKIVIVEYKMKKMANDPEELHKKDVGELWEKRSDGRCRFGWIFDKDWHKLKAILDGA